MPDVFLAVGHGMKPDGVFDPGAVGPDFIEHEKAHKVVNRVARALQRSGVSFVAEHDAGASHDPNFVESAIRANALGVKLAVEVHFNAGGGTGPEALFLSDRGREFATRCSELVAKSLDLPDRGPKKRTDLGFLNATAMPACLVEVCFVDSAVDRSKFRATPAGEAIARAICDHLSKEFVPAPSA
jgi:N-acetylmuramoyl-L-alanine amidase